jgi:hypothetical protein
MFEDAMPEFDWWGGRHENTDLWVIISTWSRQ